VLPDGQLLTVDKPLFIGRNPARASGDAAGELLPVNDETKSVSKTHAFIEVDAVGLWVTDLDSTNGVFVALPDAEGVQAEPGERVSVPAGADIALGEFVIQVERG
jgi:pSer/pThr/pTyr-binding forkhead associated (FHA) protein